MKSSVFCIKEDWWSNFTSNPKNNSFWNPPKTGDQKKKLEAVKKLFKPQSSKNKDLQNASTAPHNKAPSPLTATAKKSPIYQAERTSKSSSALTCASQSNTTTKSIQILREDSSRRCIVLSGFPKGTPNTSIISLVRGGAIEKLTFLNGEAEQMEQDICSEVRKSLLSGSIKYPVMILSFLYPADASRFMEYVNDKSLLKFHNKPLSAHWAHDNSLQFSVGYHLAPHIAQEIDANHASRYVILSRSSRKTIIDIPHGHRHPQAYSCFSTTFNCNALKTDFAQFGQIIEVVPLLDKKLAISLQFADIRSAILVMHTFKSKTSVLRSKYSLWTLRYLPDIANYPCYRP